MPPDTWKRVEELFEAALAERPEKRKEFLERACPKNAELRDEVLSLLESDATAEGFLEGLVFERGKQNSQLKPGEKLDHFEIVELIGRGGMGDVYKARDVRLQRNVAIKLLPPDVVRDSSAVLRFEREARAASALNHPNIVCIYETGRSGQQCWIVSELLTGHTLRQLMQEGPLTVRTAIDIAVQLAQGLGAAHASGIVHRDLNPANVMISADGRAKILDFGIAKRGISGGSEDRLNTANDLTKRGLVMGTPGYMAPEQLRGEEADSRSDIYSLGVILYEMLAGRRAFPGGSPAEVLSSNLSSDPPDLTQAIPLPLQQITRRCLEKEPTRRFQSAVDVGFALIAYSDSPVADPTSKAQKTAWRRWLVAAVSAMMLAVGIFYVARLAGRREVAEPQVNLARITKDAGLTTDGAISADGRLVAYASDRDGADNLDIWVKQIGGSGPAVRLTQNHADDYDPAFSPDGAQIAFRSERNGGGIYEIPSLGGDERLLIDRGIRPRFSADGRFLLYCLGVASWGTSGINSHLFVQSVAGGAPQQVGKGCESIDSTGVWSPDGQYVMFEGLCHAQRAVWRYGVKDQSLRANQALYNFLSNHSLLVSSSGVMHPTAVFHEWLGEPSRLLLSGFSARAQAMTDAVSITSVGISNDGMRVTGETHNLTFETHPEHRVSSAANGRTVLSSVETSSDLWSLPMNESGNAMGEPVKLTSDGDTGPPWCSRDGAVLSFQLRRGDEWELRSMDAKTGKQTPVHASAWPVYEPVVNSDGSKIAYMLNQDGHYSVWQVASTGGLPQKLLDEFFYPTDWSPDGRFLIGLPERPNGEVKIFDLQTLAATTILSDPRRGLYEAHLSTSGAWITFNAVAGLHSQLYVAPFRRAGIPQRDWIAITDGSGWDDKPHFSRDGKLLFFTSDRDGYRCIWAQALGPKMEVKGEPSAVYHFHRSRRSIGNLSLGALELAVRPKALVFNQQDFRGNLWLLDRGR